MSNPGSDETGVYKVPLVSVSDLTGGGCRGLFRCTRNGVLRYRSPNTTLTFRFGTDEIKEAGRSTVCDIGWSAFDSYEQRLCTVVFLMSGFDSVRSLISHPHANVAFGVQLCLWYDRGDSHREERLRGILDAVPYFWYKTEVWNLVEYKSGRFVDLEHRSRSIPLPNRFESAVRSGVLTYCSPDTRHRLEKPDTSHI